MFKYVLEALRLVADIVTGVKEAREADVNKALNGYASGRSGNEAANQAGKQK